MPPLTVTVSRSGAISTRGGRSATDTRSPLVSAMGLKEWAVPSARSRPPPRSSSWSAATLRGRTSLAALKRTLPAQLVSACGSFVISTYCLHHTHER